jgi:hypothetical protein
MAQFEVELADAILSGIAAQTADIRERLAILEARPEIKYAGTFALGKTYQPGNLCTRSGALWLCCESDVTTQPGTDAKWKLIVKSGDAR